MLGLYVGLVWGTLFSSALAEEASDKDIASHIETEFVTDHAVPSNAIDVATRNGIVTFTGFVNNL
jgi:osmotically-inducible protein OsmY